MVWVANLASLELHTSLSQAPDMERPKSLVFDLDPGPPADIVLCCQVALWLRAIMAEHGLEILAKTSGSKGMQLYVPLNTEVGYQETKTAALGLAQRLEREHPRVVVSMMERARREGKIFIDWSQNDQHKTTVNAYSLRARPRPTVSTPVTWDEVEACLKSGNPSDLVFEAPQVLERIDRHGDLFESLLDREQRLPDVFMEGVEAPVVDPSQRKASWARRREIEKARADQI